MWMMGLPLERAASITRLALAAAASMPTSGKLAGSEVVVLKINGR
jgi:hypothetical protein